VVVLIISNILLFSWYLYSIFRIFKKVEVSRLVGYIRNISIILQASSFIFFIIFITTGTVSIRSRSNSLTILICFKYLCYVFALLITTFMDIHVGDYYNYILNYFKLTANTFNNQNLQEIT